MHALRAGTRSHAAYSKPATPDHTKLACLQALTTEESVDNNNKQVVLASNSPVVEVSMFNTQCSFQNPVLYVPKPSILAKLQTLTLQKL